MRLDFTILIDGWTDNAHNSIYAVMLCCRDFDVFVGVLDLFGKRHTANNVREALKTLFARVGISFEKAIAICTDSPSFIQMFKALRS